MQSMCELCLDLDLHKPSVKAINEPTGGFNHDGIFDDIKE